MAHRDDCPCVNCNPIPCKDCGMASPKGTHLNSAGVCKHRKACEGRQLLNVGASTEVAAGHAQGRDVGGVAPALDPESVSAAKDADEWPYPDDPPDPL